MGLISCALSLCLFYDENVWGIILISLFLVIFNISDGPLIWVYSAEVCHDSAFGITNLVRSLSSILNSSVNEYMMTKMGTPGTFLFFGIITLSGAIFTIVFLKETKNLTEN